MMVMMMMMMMMMIMSLCCRVLSLVTVHHQFANVAVVEVCYLLLAYY